jgi:hypothetical protein
MKSRDITKMKKDPIGIKRNFMSTITKDNYPFF